MKQYRFLMIVLLLLSFSADVVAQTKKVGTRRTRVSKVVVKQPEPDKIDTVETVIPVTQPSFTALLAGKWKLVSVRIQQKDALKPLPGNSYIEFKSDGTANGLAACNMFNAAFTATGATLFFTSVVATEKDCDPAMLEDIILKHLRQTVKSFSLTDADLALKDGTGSTVFECKRMEK